MQAHFVLKNRYRNCFRAKLSTEDVCKTDNFLDRLDMTTYIFPFIYCDGLKDKQ